MTVIKKILNSWSPRCLTLQGKITVVKSLVIPHILQLASSVTFSQKLLSDIEKLLFEFIWNKKHLVSKCTLQLPRDLGGLKMVSVKHIVETAKIMWVKRYCNDINAKWKLLASVLMGLDKSNLLKKQFFHNLRKNIKTSFYDNLLDIWFHFLLKNLNSMDSFIQEPIFDNPHFLVGNAPISIQAEQNPGLRLITVRDIWDSQSKTIKSQNYLEGLFNTTVPCMFFNQIVCTVSSVLKSVRKYAGNIALAKIINIPNKCLTDISKIKSSEIYSYYLALEYSPPKSQNKWIEYYPFLETLDWKPVYLLPFRIMNDAYLITFQYKILHRVFSCNYNLFNWNIRNSPLCDICQKSDNLEHYFYFCSDSKTFWAHVNKWLSQLLSSKFNFTVLEILFGVINAEPKYWFPINFVLLTGKNFIYKCKKNNKELFLNNFLQNLTWNLKLEEGIFIKQGKLSTFNERYKILFDSLK